MGICRLPEIKMYWIISRNFCPVVCKIMKFDDFTYINKFFSLVSMKKNGEIEIRNIGGDTEKIFEYLNDKFIKIYYPGEHISIYEGMSRYLGKFRYKAFMPNKPIKKELNFIYALIAKHYMLIL